MTEIIETTAVTLREIPPRPLVDLPEPELLDTVRQSLSDCKFRIGEASAIWCRKYAAGRTDADFGELVGLTPDTVNDYRRVWERFGDSGALRKFHALEWTHFKTVLTRDDAETLLDWANTEKQSVRGLIAYRRMIDGEDLTDDAPKNSDPLNCMNAGPAGPASVESLDTENRPTLAEYAANIADEPTETPETEPKPSGDATAYSPFRSGAASPPAEREPTATQKTAAAEITAAVKQIETISRTIGRKHGGRFLPLLADQLGVLQLCAAEGQTPAGLDADAIAATIRRIQNH